MSIEDLKADIERNVADLETRPLLTIEDVKTVLKDTVLPLFKSVADEIEEIDDDLSDMVEHADSILQEEDATLFALVFKEAVGFAGALEKRLKQNENDNRWRARLQQFQQLLQTASARLMEITVRPEDEEDDDPDAPDDDASPEARPALASVPANDQGAR